MRRDPPIIYLALGQILTWAGLYYIFPALLVRWEQSLGWSKADLTAAITLAIFVSAITAPISGRLIDIGKGPLLMTGSTILGALCLFSLSYVTQLSQFYLVWGLIGVTLAGCLYEPCFALITRARGEKAKQGIILVTLIAGFASTISFPTAHSLAEAFGWRVTVQIFACFVLVVATPLMWAGSRLMEQSGNPEISEKQNQQSGHRAFLGKPAFWMLACGFSFAAVLHGVTLHHLLPVLFERGVHADVAVTIASFIGPMQISGRLAMMAAQRHVSNHGIAVSCFVVLGISVLILNVSGATPALLVSFVILFGGGYGMVSIIRPVIARDILGEHNFGSKSGALALIYLAGSASAPFLGSIIWNIGGYELVLPCLVLLAIFGLGLYLSAHYFSRRQSR
jgi:MFS family permease